MGTAFLSRGESASSGILEAIVQINQIRANSRVNIPVSVQTRVAFVSIYATGSRSCYMGTIRPGDTLEFYTGGGPGDLEVAFDPVTCTIVVGAASDIADSLTIGNHILVVCF